MISIRNSSVHNKENLYDFRLCSRPMYVPKKYFANFFFVRTLEGELLFVYGKAKVSLSLDYLKRTKSETYCQGKLTLYFFSRSFDITVNRRQLDSAVCRNMLAIWSNHEIFTFFSQNSNHSNEEFFVGAIFLEFSSAFLKLWRELCGSEHRWN